MKVECELVHFARQFSLSFESFMIETCRTSKLQDLLLE
jgi:hypothetical protein